MVLNNNIELRTTIDIYGTTKPPSCLRDDVIIKWSWGDFAVYN